MIRLVKCVDCDRRESAECSERRKAWNPLCEGCAREVSDETENEENEK